MIQRKIDQLGEADRQLLVAASVQGQEFDSAVVAGRWGWTPADVEERLEVLERVHALVRLVREQEFPDGTLTLRYGSCTCCTRTPCTRAAADAAGGAERGRGSGAAGLHRGEGRGPRLRAGDPVRGGAGFKHAANFYLQAARTPPVSSPITRRSCWGGEGWKHCGCYPRHQNATAKNLTCGSTWDLGPLHSGPRGPGDATAL